jgi:hypothetical protein
MQEATTMKRIQIVCSQVAGEVVNRLNILLADGWKIQDYTVLSCQSKTDLDRIVLVPTWCVTVYRENNI